MVGLEDMEGINLCQKKWGGVNSMVELPISDGEEGLQYFLKNVGKFVSGLNKMETGGVYYAAGRGKADPGFWWEYI